jgi:hypothetical protein
VRATHRRNGFRRSAHFDLRCGLAPKDVQEQFAWRTAESSRRFARPKRHPLVGSGPLDLEPATVKPPTQIAAAAANVAPQGSIHCRREATGPSIIGPANVLVMNKELVEIRHGTDPSDAEEPDGRAGPDPRDEPRKVLARGQTGPTPLGEPFEGTGQNKTRASNEIVFSQHEVCGQIVSSPALEQCGNGTAELVEKITKLKALLRVQRNISHDGGVYGATTQACPSAHRDIALTTKWH